MTAKTPETVSVSVETPHANPNEALIEAHKLATELLKGSAVLVEFEHEIGRVIHAVFRKLGDEEPGAENGNAMISEGGPVAPEPEAPRGA